MTGASIKSGFQVRGCSWFPLASTADAITAFTSAAAWDTLVGAREPEISATNARKAPFSMVLRGLDPNLGRIQVSRRLWYVLIVFRATGFRFRVWIVVMNDCACCLSSILLGYQDHPAVVNSFFEILDPSTQPQTVQTLSRKG